MRKDNGLNRNSNSKRRSQAGMSLVETLVAVSMLLVVAAGVLTIAVTALTTTENQGHLAARTAEYAQDKMEQLLALKYCDGSSDTTQFPSPPGGGTGLAGCTLNPDGSLNISGTGGSSNTAAPLAQYSDYLDKDGNILSSAGGVPANWYYIRAWQISSPAANLKQIAVTVQVRYGVGRGGRLAQSTIVSMKSFPF